MFHKKSSCFMVVILCLLFALNAVSAFAEDGDGTGGGDGKNRDIPLTLENASIADGAADIAVNETIQLNFNKNICNVTVLANNKTCFHLTDENGTAVPIRLIFPDNQVQKDYRREVFVRPARDLAKNARYRLSVDSTLRAKNGMTMDNAHTLDFITGTRRSDAENKILKKLGQNIITYETAYRETGDSVPVDKSGLDAPSSDRGPAAGTMAKIAAAILILVILGFTAVLFILKRRKE